jgi:tRNA nucleotidyltransferase (CCA-adding enzyme)
MPLALDPPRNVRQIARRLEKAGFDTWCVGGAVRDALLGHPHLDWDLATAARPADVRRLFPRTVPVGIDFGTVGVLDDDGVMHEVTTYRRDVQTDGRHAVVEFGATLEEDLARRDYTINAIAYSPARDEIRDPFAGRSDLEEGIVRAVGDPRERMREDRLRALRAIRFAARFGFTIDRETWNAIVESAPYLTRLSAERVKQEIEKTMDQVLLPSAAFSMWTESGAMRALIPSMANVSGLELSAIDHLRQPGLKTRPQRRPMRLIALFSAASAGDLEQTLRGLRFSNSEIAWIGAVVRGWHALRDEMTSALVASTPPVDAVIRTWAARTGRTRLAPVLRLAGAHWAAARDADAAAPSPQSVASAYRRALRIAYRDPIEVADLAIGGRDLEKLGLRGPAVGLMLRRMLEAVISEPAMNTPDVLVRLARELRDAEAGSTEARDD